MNYKCDVWWKLSGSWETQPVRDVISFITVWIYQIENEPRLSLGLINNRRCLRGGKSEAGFVFELLLFLLLRQTTFDF